MDTNVDANDMPTVHIGSLNCRNKCCKGLKPHKVGDDICKHPLFGGAKDD